jgi:hypothetical protein
VAPPDFVAQGISNESADAALMAAKDALSKQLVAEIEKSTSTSSAEPSLIHLAGLRAAVLLEDAELGPAEARDGRFSASARLERPKAIHRAKLHFIQSLAGLRAEIDQADRAIRAKQAAPALRSLLESKEGEAAARADALTLAALGEPSVEAIPAPASRLRGWLKSVRLELEGGDQSGTCGRPLARPLIVRAILNDGSEEVPIAGLPLVFSTDDDDAKLSPPETTDSEGLARTPIHSIGGCTDEETRGVATVDWEAFLKEADPAQRTRWIAELPYVAAKFRFTKKR